MKKRILSLLLMLCMILTMVPTFRLQVLAEGAGALRTTTLDCRNLSTQTNSSELWAWNSSTKTLTLSGVNIHTTNIRGIILPGNSTIIVNGENNIVSDSNQGIICTNDISLGYSYAPLTITSTTKGTLNVSNENLSDSGYPVSAIVAGGITTNNVNFNVTSGTASAIISTTDASMTFAPLVFNGGTATLNGVFNSTGSAGLKGSSVTVENGAVVTCSGTYGIKGTSISIDGILNSKGYTAAFSTNPTITNPNLKVIDNTTKQFLVNKDLTQYKDLSLFYATDQSTISTILSNGISPEDIKDITLILKNPDIEIPLKSDNGNYTENIPNGEYEIYINGNDSSKSINVTESNKNFNLYLYKLTLNKVSGVTSVSGDGVYTDGMSVAISTTLDSNQIFDKWSSTPAGYDNTNQSTTIIMPAADLALTATVQNASSLNLGSPIYQNGESEFYFPNATITGITTNIKSITLKLDNYTNVLSKPSVPAVSNELSNIAGTTNTITYLFGDGITQADAQSFLRGLKFRYGGLKASSTTNVSVTVDGNKTNLPTDASITEFNGHYYMYVNDYLSWTDAYNKAKTYSYMGMIGYLATITSAQEDKMLDNISMNGAWSAGTRYTGAYDTNTAPGGALNNYFKWACGPEAGTNYYCFNSTSSKYPVSGAYNGFVDAGEPNGYTKDGKTECCMQVHYKGESSTSSSTWNDLRDIIYCGDYNGSGYEPKVGYFVEFSDYSGGRVDDYSQSANGKSAVSISVEKGDVFNTIKDGGTYYVDTKLTAFDRNITNITVNGSAFTSGNKLAGDMNTTYNIVATDIEGNTAIMTVTMKTIASISDPIKYLTVSNVQMSNKDSILAVKAALMAIDQTDASDAQKTEITNAIQNCKNLYFALFSASSTATNGTNGWYKNGISDIILTAPDGFQISTSNNGTWTSNITVDKADGANKTASYYLKEISTGDISGIKTFNYKVDTAAPTGTITIKSNTFKNFINTITFGLFFKSSVDVSISASDNLSTSTAISYQKTKDGESYIESGTWVDGSSFSVTANEKFSVYAKLTDDAGNMTIINSDGVVVYNDSTQNTTDISFTKTGTTDVTAKVNLNGNTVEEIKNGESLIASTNYLVATDGTITFKASYLDSLAVGTYTLTVSYNPMGESYVTGTSIGDAPLTTTISLAVKAKDMSETGGVSAATVTITPDSCTYTGSRFDPDVTVKDGTKTLVKDTDYILSWTADMTSAGEKTLAVTFIGDYIGTVTKKVIINNAAIADTTNKTQSTTYNKNAQSVSAPNGTTVNSQGLTVKYSADGKDYNLDSALTFTVAGNYTVYYQLSAPNHDTVTGQIAFKINAATDNSITDLTLNNWTFGDKANVPTATAKYGTIGYTYSDSENGTYTNTVPTQAGTYYVKASVAATGDYNGCEAKTSFTISSKTIAAQDIAISGIDDYYIFTNSEIKPEPTVTVDGIVLKEVTDYTVGYENNIQIGTNAKVIITLKGNYSGTAEKIFEIRYGKLSDTEVKNAITLPDFNSNGWYNKDITIAAKDGWTICKTPTGTFGNLLTISDESGKTGTDYTFYIKKADGSVYERTLNYKLDKHDPTDLEVKYNTNSFRSFLNTITFGVFFKENVNVTANAKDELSGIASYQYFATDSEITDFDSVTWTNSLSIAPNSKKIIYVKAIDNAGNYIIAKEGVVVYTDSTQNTTDISFTKTGTADVSAKVNLNGNTVKEIKNGANLIASTNYSVATDGTITFKASYIDSLAVGTYTLTVSYNPIGESYAAGTSIGDAPLTTTLSIAVKAKDMSDEGGVSAANVTVTPGSYTYTGSTFDPAVTVKDGTKTLVKDTDYTLSWTADMASAGEKTLTVTFIGDYIGTVTKKVIINNAAIADTTNKTQSATYNKNAQTVSAAKGTTVNNQVLTVKYSTDGKNYNLDSAPTFTIAGNYTVYYQLSAPNHDTVTGEIAFKINAATDNSITDLTLSSWTFGEKANVPTATAKYGTISYTYSDSENGTYTNTVPTQAGTYYVKASVAATGDYNGCEAKTSFTISSKTIAAKDIAISGIDEYYLFTNSEIKPEPIVTVDGIVMQKDTDYTVDYENNVQIGKNAKVIVTLKDNYSGTTEKIFEIRYGNMSDTEFKNAITLPDFNSNGWYNKDIAIAAKDDWMLCKTPTGAFGKSLTISDESGKTGTDYTFYIKKADGSVYERTLKYKLDKSAPEGSIAIEKSGIKNFLHTVTFGLLFNSDVDVTVTSNDILSGIAKVEVYKADKELTKQELDGVEWSAYTASVHETAKDEEHFIYYARITDNAGNEEIVNSDGVIFDTTPPVISGITDNETYYTSQKVTVTDPNFDNVVVNGKDFTSGSTISGNTNATYQIVATDKAGNVSTYTVIMKPISNLSGNIDNLTEDDVKPGEQKDIEEIKKKAEAVDTTNATPEEKRAIQDIIDKCDRLLKKIGDAQNDTKLPQTGYTNNMPIWGAMFLFFGGALIMFSGNKKRKKVKSK